MNKNKNMNKEELSKVLENHEHWLNTDCDNWESMRANLCGANLRYANLRDADLRDADLRGADLRDADLRDADLRDADLCGADLCSADLHGADLRDAYLCGAYLRYANLRDVNLRDADLCYANLRYADLRGADLHGADLRGADLCDADLRGADLCGAYNVPFIPYACPDFGAFIGYKKARDGYIVELEILADARRMSATSRKCRCDKAKVLRILNPDRTVSNVCEVRSKYDVDFIYKVGEIVEAENFDEDRWKECSEGIHFFVNFQEAVNYN